jgi:hypothetical protein
VRRGDGKRRGECQRHGACAREVGGTPPAAKDKAPVALCASVEHHCSFKPGDESSVRHPKRGDNVSRFHSAGVRLRGAWTE